MNKRNRTQPRSAEELAKIPHWLDTQKAWHASRSHLPPVCELPLNDETLELMVKEATEWRIFDKSLGTCVLDSDLRKFKNMKHLLKSKKAPHLIFLYTNIINGRRPWPNAERIILRSPEYSQNYAYMILKGRWPEGEKTILKCPSAASHYAHLVIEGPWPEAEGIIATDPASVIYYGDSFKRGRWPEAERVILNSKPHHACSFAQRVLRRPWLEGESFIKESKSSWDHYEKHVLA